MSMCDHTGFIPSSLTHLVLSLPHLASSSEDPSCSGWPSPCNLVKATIPAAFFTTLINNYR